MIYWGEKLEAPIPVRTPSHFKPLERPNTVANIIAKNQRLVRILKRFRKPEDIGLGDTVARLAGGKNGKRFADWISDWFGTICGCENAQKWLNAKFPY